jgi:hypothetical protein
MKTRIWVKYELQNDGESSFSPSIRGKKSHNHKKASYRKMYTAHQLWKWKKITRQCHALLINTSLLM